jgi:hypothetical protein
VSPDADVAAITKIAQQGIDAAVECQTFELDLSKNSYGDVIFDKKKVRCSCYRVEICMAMYVCVC